MSRAKTASADDANERDFQHHLLALGLSTVEQYLDWCDEHGFSRRVRKRWTLRCQERYCARQAIAHERMRSHKRHSRNPLEAVLALCEGRTIPATLGVPHIERLRMVMRRYDAAGIKGRKRAAALKNLIVHAHEVRADFFHAGPAIANLGARPGNTFFEVLSQFGEHEGDWLRPLETWRPRSHSAGRQLVSLARHLFVRFEMPDFFDAVWAQPQCVAERLWYVRVGRGENIRHCDLPLTYTRKMGRFFMLAPHDLTVDRALRWGQILGLSGTERLARALVATRLGESFEHEEFWSTVIAWFIAHPNVELSDVGPIVDYLHYQRFVPEHVDLGPDRGPAAPPQPRLTMKGRTVQSLRRQVHAWHGHLARGNTVQVGEWAHTEFSSFEFLEGSAEGHNRKRWTIRELTSGRSLNAEGKQLKHCVSSYASECARGRTSIWTLELQTSVGLSKLLTIEIRNQVRQIVQARGKRNRLPTEKERQVLQRWATEAGLRLASYI